MHPDHTDANASIGGLAGLFISESVARPQIEMHADTAKAMSQTFPELLRCGVTQNTRGASQSADSLGRAIAIGTRSRM